MLALKLSPFCTKRIIMWKFLLDQTDKIDNDGTAASLLQLMSLGIGAFNQNGEFKFCVNKGA